jgi:hypothetical protein
LPAGIVYDISKRKMKLKGILGSAALIFICQFGLAEPHNWTFKTGVTFPGEFVSATTNSVIVEMEGRNFSLAVTNLVDDDVAYVQKTIVDRRQAALRMSMQQADFRNRKGEQYEHVVMLSTNQPIVITAVFDDNSEAGLPLCRVKGFAVNILIKDLPGNVIDFVNHENDLVNKIVDDRGAYELADILAPHEEGSVSVGVGSENGTSWGSVNVAVPFVTRQRAEADLKGLKLSHEEIDLQRMLDSPENATIIAFPSAETFNGYQVWYCNQK